MRKDSLKFKELNFQLEKENFLEYFPNWKELIEYLPPKHQRIIKQRYGLGEYETLTLQPTLTSIAKEMNVSRQAVQNAALKALAHLEKAKYKEERIRKILA